MLSIRNVRRHSVWLLSWSLVAAGFTFLALEPRRWLVETWADPSYGSAGGHFLAVAAGLAIWSASSPPEPRAPSARNLWWCLPAAASLRLAGHLLIVPAIGALVIPVGVYALGRLARLSQRRRAVSPVWLAMLVGLTLPVEHIVKRLVGYGLQHIAADGTCSLLRLVYSNVTCNGLDIALQGQEIFVALPCSGARGLLLYTIFFVGLAALVRPSVRQAAAGLGVAVTASVVVNCLRIALLAAGLAHGATLGVDVMQKPWHMAVGFACLPFGLAQVGIWAHWVARASPEQNRSPDASEPADCQAPRLIAVVSFVAVAVAIPSTPKYPVDAAGSNLEPALPDQLAGFSAEPNDLLPVERDHFTKLGGDVAKASYGPHTLLLVESSTPLRHLLVPDEWLGDIGYSVESAGHTVGPIPANSYRVKSPDGRRWQLDATFVSERGRLATRPSEAIWYWLRSPTTTWRALYRLHPDTLEPGHIDKFDRSLADYSQFDR